MRYTENVGKNWFERSPAAYCSAARSLRVVIPAERINELFDDLG